MKDQAPGETSTPDGKPARYQLLAFLDEDPSRAALPRSIHPIEGFPEQPTFQDWQNRGARSLMNLGID